MYFSLKKKKKRNEYKYLDICLDKNSYSFTQELTEDAVSTVATSVALNIVPGSVSLNKLLKDITYKVFPVTIISATLCIYVYVNVCFIMKMSIFLSQDALLKVKCTLNVVLHVPQLAVKGIQDLAPYNVWQDVSAPMIPYLMKKATNVSQLTNAVRSPYICISLHTT